MRKILFILLSAFSMVSFVRGQVICIFCYDQNEPVSAPVTNLIYNGGFETGCLVDQHFCPASQNFACYFDAWYCTGGDSLTYARAEDNTWSFIPEGILAAYFGNLFSNSCSTVWSDTSCFSTFDCEVTGIPSGYPINNTIGYGGATGVSLEQTVGSLTPGNTYVLEFWTGGEWDSGTFSQSGLFAVDLGFGKIFLRDKITAPVTGIGRRFIIIWNATAASHTIKFTNWGHACQECTELVLDDVSLYTIAELASWVPSCATSVSFPENSSYALQIAPNPFTSSATIVFGREVHDATFTLYNLLGEKVYQACSIQTESFEFNRGTLIDEAYLYEVTEEEKIICIGKAIIY